VFIAHFLQHGLGRYSLRPASEHFATGNPLAPIHLSRNIINYLLKSMLASLRECHQFLIRLDDSSAPTSSITKYQLFWKRNGRQKGSAVSQRGIRTGLYESACLT
jgi:hypothetical protein